jgi:hypothetical protein
MAIMRTRFNRTNFTLKVRSRKTHLSTNQLKFSNTSEHAYTNVNNLHVSIDSITFSRSLFHASNAQLFIE